MKRMKELHCASTISPTYFKYKFNQSVAEEINTLMHPFNNEGKLDKFEKFFAHNGVVCVQKDGVLFVLHPQ